jgi:hypothetical protein
MDFKTLGENSPIYIVHKKPFLFEMGTLKSKGTKPLNQFPYIQQPMTPTIDIVVSTNGTDETLPGIPANLEIVEYKNSFYSTTPEGAQQAIANLIQFANNGIAEQAYYQSVQTEGEKAMERLNPQYAEGKRQARTIEDLQKRQDEQSKMLSDIYQMMQKIAPKS